MEMCEKARALDLKEALPLTARAFFTTISLILSEVCSRD
jgi:hypothetical protein